jgi:hypothetical protein
MPANHYKIQLTGNDQGGNSWMMVFAYEMDDSSFADSYAASRALVDAWILSMAYTKLKPLIGNDIAIKTAKCTRFNHTPEWSVVKILDETGTASSNAFSVGTAANYRWISTSNTESSSSHSYIPGPPIDAIDADRWQPAYLTALSTWGTAVLAILNVGTATASFGWFQKKTSTFLVANHSTVAPKVALLNKRLRPQL